MKKKVVLYITCTAGRGYMMENVVLLETEVLIQPSFEVGADEDLEVFVQKILAERFLLDEKVFRFMAIGWGPQNVCDPVTGKFETCQTHRFSVEVYSEPSNPLVTWTDADGHVHTYVWSKDYPCRFY